MFPVQLALAALVWAASIVLLVRQREELIARAKAQTRGGRTLTALVCVLFSVLVLAMMMAVLAKGGLTKEGFTTVGWVATTLTGATFIRLQTLGLVPLVLNAVTPNEDRSSDREDSNPL